MRRWTLGDMLAPLAVESFLGRTIGKRYAHYRGEPGKFLSLLSWRDVNRLLCNTGLDLARVRIGRDGQFPEFGFRQNAISGFSVVQVAQFNELLTNGGTVLIDAAEDVHEPILECCRAIEEVLELPVQAQIRADFWLETASGTNAYDHDVLIFAVLGRSRWRIGLPSAPGTADQANESSFVRDVELDQGDLLYVPRGWPHAETNVFDPALFVIVIFKNPTGLELVARLFDRLKEADVMKVDVPRFSNDEVKAAYLTELQSEILRVCTEPGLLVGFMKDLRAISEPRRSLSLPWSAMPDFSLLPRHLELSLTVRFPNEDTLFYPGAGDALEIIHEHKRVLIDRDAAGLVECLIQSGVLSVGGLLAKFPASEERLLTKLRGLVQLGLIIVREPGTSGQS